MCEIRPDLAPTLEVEGGSGEAEVGGNTVPSKYTAYKLSYRGDTVFYITHWRLGEGDDAFELERVGEGEIEVIMPEEAK